MPRHFGAFGDITFEVGVVAAAPYTVLFLRQDDRDAEEAAALA